MRKTTLAVFVVWTAGLCSASALAYTLVKKPVPVAQVEEKKEPTEALVPNIEGFKVPKPMVMAPVVKAVKAQITQTVKRPVAKQHGMKCTSWKSMSTTVAQSVRYCN